MCKRKIAPLDCRKESETVAFVAASVFDHRKQPVACLWISVLSDRITSSRLDLHGAKVQQFAEQLSKQLGYQR